MDYESLYEIETMEEILATFKGKDLNHFIGLFKPVMQGIVECFMRLEYRDYPPGTARNDLLIIRRFEWHNATWILVTLPKEDMHLVEKAATEFELDVIEGTPLGITEDKIILFPFQGKNVFWLCNNKDHPARKNSPQIKAAYADSIKETLERIRGECKNLKPPH